jgi:hypothetical protein
LVPSITEAPGSVWIVTSPVPSSAAAAIGVTFAGTLRWARERPAKTARASPSTNRTPRPASTTQRRGSEAGARAGTEMRSLIRAEGGGALGRSRETPFLAGRLMRSVGGAWRSGPSALPFFFTERTNSVGSTLAPPRSGFSGAKER